MANMIVRVGRRGFLRQTATALAALRVGAAFGEQGSDPGAPEFKTANRRWQGAYDAALAVLAGNVQVLPRVDLPVLIEGSSYQGIWMECGPLEALVYRRFRRDVARNSHMTFFALQKEDGQFPSNNKRNEAGFGQIQMVVPIAATTWELARDTGDDELLHTAYAACSRWDAWLVRYRNTRGTGLVEGFCTYDTGMDNSRRWEGMPNRCANNDAKQCPDVAGLPRLCPDLSATVYGQRVALAAMAKAIGRSADADRWMESAETLRGFILKHLYVEEDAAFYDLDAQERFIKVRSIVLARMCSEQVPDQAMFDRLWLRQLHNPKAFWTAFPLPSVAADDPLFVRPIPRNSWGGAAQALTALRAGRWFDYYGRSAEFGVMMNAWCEAIQRDPTFRQQIDPLTGEFTQSDQPKYSPCALVMMDYTWRLAGVREESDELHWNIRLGHPAADAARFRMRTDAGREALLRYDSRGAELMLAGKMLGRLEGGAVRVVTAKDGAVKELVGIAEQMQRVVLRLPGKKDRVVNVAANQVVKV